MLLTDGNYSCGSYRFGFNGQEKDDEWTGSTGSHLAFTYRIYDSRLGRFLSVDPLAKKYVSWTPYLFAANSPIVFIDFQGCGPRYKAIAKTLQDQLDKLEAAGVSYTTVTTDEQIIIKVTLKVGSDIFSTTYTFSEETDDWADEFKLGAWGVDPYMASIAAEKSWLKRIRYKLMSLDDKATSRPVLTYIEFLGFIATAGELTVLKKVGKKYLWKKGVAIFAGLLLANDMSEFLRGENRTLLEELGLSENHLEIIKAGNVSLGFLRSMKKIMKGNIDNVSDEAAEFGKAIIQSIELVEKYHKLIEINNKHEEKQKKAKESLKSNNNG